MANGTAAACETYTREADGTFARRDTHTGDAGGTFARCDNIGRRGGDSRTGYNGRNEDFQIIIKN